MGLGQSQPESTTWSHGPVDPPPAGIGIEVRSIVSQATGKDPKRADPWHRRLVLGKCNVTSLVEKVPELVR